MRIINYNAKYANEVKQLLVELQAYIVSIDKDKYNILTNEYKEEYFKKVMKEVKEYQGKIFLAKDKDKILGLVVTLINNDPISSYDFKCPKRGRISELVTTKESRNLGVGNKLLTKAEQYLKKQGCEAILIGVFGYNENALNFYHHKGYNNRMLEVIKHI